MNTDWSHTIKNLVIIVLLLFLAWRGCEGRTGPPEGNILKVETYTDTTYKTVIDTIFFIKDSTVTKTVLSYTNVQNVEKDSSKLYTFKSHISDSLIAGDITTNVKVKDSLAILVNQNIQYIAKFPKYIHQKDSIFIHDSTVVTKLDTRARLFFGADVAISTQNSAGTIVPKIGIDLKNTIIEGGYDVFNKQIVAGVKYKIKRKNK